MSKDITILDSEVINISKNTNKYIYQDLNKPFDKLSINLEHDSTLELLIYNSSCTIDANIKENACLTIYNVGITSDNYECNINVYLKEINATCNIINLYLGINNSLVNSNIMIHHENKNTTSNLDTYAIAKNNAKLILNNNAFIKQGMKQSAAKQMTKGLNLSKNSTIKAQPNLLIDEYDVIASHSASIGSINKEDLFYLMSRGLTLAKAEEIVITGFVKPILSEIKKEDIEEAIYNQFIKFLK